MGWFGVYTELSEDIREILIFHKNKSKHGLKLEKYNQSRTILNLKLKLKF